MIYLLDTTAFSELMRRHPLLTTRLGNARFSDKVVICTIVKGEIRFGIRRLAAGQRQIELEAQAAALFALLSCEPVPETAADSYAMLKLQSQKAGIALSENDLWIAATALALGAVLVTHDADFGRLRGLICEDWTMP